MTAGGMQAASIEQARNAIDGYWPLTGTIGHERGTYRFAWAGETVTTAAELDALPVGSVIREQRDGYLWGKRDGDGWSVGNSGSPLAALHIVNEHAPLTVLFRPDAPQQATTDGTIERAVEAYFTPGLDTTVEGVFRDGWKQGHRAALAAAGAGEAVNREALREAFRAWVKGDRSCNTGEALAQELAEVARVPLDPRGDAAPTEVEWGVEEEDGDWTVFAEALDPNARQNAQEWATTAGSPLMQRTVSAWREVQQ